MDILIFGLVNSMTYVLMAAGFTLVYGVSRLPNFAHGALYVLTGFLVWTFVNSAGLNYFVSIVITIVIVALLGALLYRFVLMRVRGMPVSEIIVSFAVALIVLEGLRLQNLGPFKGFIGSSYTLPAFISGTVSIAGVVIDIQRLLIVGIGLAIVLFMWVFTRRQKIGLAFRGMAQDEHAAMMLGIDSDFMAVLALAVGSSLAAVAAVAVYPLGQVTVETGYHVLNAALAVCIVGGLGSWMGAILAS
ncbi:MAG: branched-chain amino acid ABC transporter permease, partial [Actinobacteria bacterium]|nr:branched-chain amino acid ABC transporter permease [Actinomycetota bacterium]